MASGLNGARNGSVATIKKSARCQSKCTCRARGASAAALKPRLIAAAARAIKPKVYFIFFIFYIAEITLPDLLFSHLRCTRVCLSPPFAYSCFFGGGLVFYLSLAAFVLTLCSCLQFLVVSVVSTAPFPFLLSPSFQTSFVPSPRS